MIVTWVVSVFVLGYTRISLSGSASHKETIKTRERVVRISFYNVVFFTVVRAHRPVPAPVARQA